VREGAAAAAGETAAALVGCQAKNVRPATRVGCTAASGGAEAAAAAVRGRERALPDAVAEGDAVAVRERGLAEAVARRRTGDVTTGVVVAAGTLASARHASAEAGRVGQCDTEAAVLPIEVYGRGHDGARRPGGGGGRGGCTRAVTGEGTRWTPARAVWANGAITTRQHCAVRHRVRRGQASRRAGWWRGSRPAAEARRMRQYLERYATH